MVRERWPPVYDWDQLKSQIREIARPEMGRQAQEQFYRSEFYAALRTEEPPICQGDVLHVETPWPYIGPEGIPQVELENSGYWLTIGNTCDFVRTETEEPYTQIVPLYDVSEEMDESVIPNLRNQPYFRQFYLPPWKQQAKPGSGIYLAQFSEPVAIHKRACRERAAVVARLSRVAWVLLHCCLVRFLARDDGREDPEGE